MLFGVSWSQTIPTPEPGPRQHSGVAHLGDNVARSARYRTIARGPEPAGGPHETCLPVRIPSWTIQRTGDGSHSTDVDVLRRTLLKSAPDFRREPRTAPSAIPPLIS